MSIKKLSKTRQQDPQIQAETVKYGTPIPSREFILKTLEQEGKPLHFEVLCNLLDVHKTEFSVFSRRLAAMEREGELMRNRAGAYMQPEKASLLAGRVQGHADGFGFFIPDDQSGDIFLDGKQMKKALHKDRVLVRVTGLDNKGRREGAIVEVLERMNTRVIGRVLIEHGVMIVAPEDKRLAQDILITFEAPADKKTKKTKSSAKPMISPKAGQIVMVDIIEQPTRHAQPIGRIVEILGNYTDPGMEIEIALRKHDLPFEFSDKALAEAEDLPTEIKKNDAKDREDIRHLPLVTIDGETAKDFDDAVFAEKNGRDFRLIVAIADVSHYVRPNMALDKEAKERGNSVYFPRRVIPMLPEKISNGLCSLNPDVDRLSMVCDMEILSTGKIKKYRFYPAVFQSKARLTYDQVWDFLDGAENSKQKAPPKEVHPSLKTLYALFKVLLKARAKRGAIDFETVETMMIFNDQGKIENIIPTSRNDAHKVIEECMLAANVCASDFLEANKHACLYRIHQGPTPEKLDNLRNFLKEFGLALTGGESPTALDYAALLNSIKERPDVNLIQTAMLRSLRQAVYSPENVGHFGLSYTHYAHFTSPIRRYPDLLVHRSIKAVLAKQKYAPAGEENAWEEIGMHCSMTERRADEATRDVTNWLKCFYMRDRIGEVFAGTISSVVPFGVFVALDSVFVEGLVHVSMLGEDYFKFDQTRQLMLGERTGKRFRLGDRMSVKLTRADLETGRIDFVPAAFTGAPSRQNLAKKPVEGRFSSYDFAAEIKAKKGGEHKSDENVPEKKGKTRTIKKGTLRLPSNLPSKPSSRAASKKEGGKTNKNASTANVKSSSKPAAKLAAHSKKSREKGSKTASLKTVNKALNKTTTKEKSKNSAPQKPTKKA